MNKRNLRAVKNPDPFEWQDTGYNKEQFYTRSVDKKGHKDTVYVPIPPNIMAAMSQLVQSRQIVEYRSVQDFVRDAVVHRLHDVNEMIQDGKLEQQVDIEMRRTRMEQRRDTLRYLNELVQTAEEACKEAINSGDKGHLAETIAEAEEELEKLREPWRSKLTEALDRYRDQIK